MESNNMQQIIDVNSVEDYHFFDEENYKIYEFSEIEIDENENNEQEAIKNDENEIQISSTIVQVNCINEIYESINKEEKILEDLEKRRKKLEKDVERLQREIEEEKFLFRKSIDDEIAKKQKIQEIKQTSRIDPFNISQEVYTKMEECREAIQESQAQDNFLMDDTEIKRLKKDLIIFKKTLDCVIKKKSHQQKKKTAAKIFQKHLDEVDLKCNKQIDHLVNIQKSIENMRVGDEHDGGNITRE